MFEITRTNYLINFWKQNAFQLVPGGFSYLIDQNNNNSDWKKILGFGNIQEKPENGICLQVTKKVRLVKKGFAIRKTGFISYKK